MVTLLSSEFGVDDVFHKVYKTFCICFHATRKTTRSLLAAIDRPQPHRMYCYLRPRLTLISARIIFFLSWLTIQANKLTSWKGNGNVVLNVLYFGMTLNQSSAAHHSLPWSSFSQRSISIYSRSKRSLVRAVPYPKFHPMFTKPNNNIRFSSKSIVEIEHAYFR